MNERMASALRKLFGTEELSDRDVKYRIIRSCVGVSIAVCVVYGAYSIPNGELLQAKAASGAAPRLVILGREDEETVAVIAETIQQADGSVLSLDDFLNTLICGACSRKCPLLAPRCRRGMAKAETQSAYYSEAVSLLESGDGELRYEDLSFQ